MALRGVELVVGLALVVRVDEELGGKERGRKTEGGGGVAGEKNEDARGFSSLLHMLRAGGKLGPVFFFVDTGPFLPVPCNGRTLTVTKRPVILASGSSMRCKHLS